MTNPTVLFLCPHGGGKSAVASSYFLQISAEKELAFDSAFVAGSDPYEEMPGRIVKYLGSQGRDVSQHIPRLVNADDLAQATHIVSIGCPLEAFEVDESKRVNWIVPMLSDDFDVAVASIQKQVDAFVEALAEGVG